MEEEISKRTITVLVILTVVVSLLGTLSVMSAMNDIRLQEQAQATGDRGSQGQVSLTITDGRKTMSPTTGMVTLGIQAGETPEEPKILLLPESTT